MSHEHKSVSGSLTFPALSKFSLGAVKPLTASYRFAKLGVESLAVAEGAWVGPVQHTPELQQAVLKGSSCQADPEKPKTKNENHHGADEMAVISPAVALTQISA